MSKYKIGIPCIESLRLGIAFNNRLNDSSLLDDARETYKDDDDIGAIFQNKRTLLNAITDAIGTSGKMSVQEWASIGKALGIYTDKI
tara:strand:+ start:3032 stop:3292 length:261 start_codon:yes stop_codon:yes gene_type:complete